MIEVCVVMIKMVLFSAIIIGAVQIIVKLMIGALSALELEYERLQEKGGHEAAKREE